MLLPLILMMFASTSYFRFHLGLNWSYINTFCVLVNNGGYICKVVLMSYIMCKISLFFYVRFLSKLLILKS